MAVIAHHPRQRDRDGDPGPAVALLRAFLTIALVTLVVAAAVGGAAYLASQVLVGMLSG